MLEIYLTVAKNDVGDISHKISTMHVKKEIIFLLLISALRDIKSM